MNSSIAEHALCNGVERQHDVPAESIYIQGIRRALGVGELLKRISNAAELKKKYLEQLKAKIEERKKSKLYVKEFDDSLAIPYKFKEESPARAWIPTVFHEEEESTDDSDGDVTEDDYREMLKLHKRRKRCRSKLNVKPSLSKFMFYSSDFITSENKWTTHQKNLKKNLMKKSKSKSVKKSKSKTSNTETSIKSVDDSAGLQNAIKQEYIQNEEASPSQSFAGKDKSPSPVSIKKKKQPSIDAIRKRHWKMIAKKDIPKAYRIRTQLRSFNLGLLRRVSREGLKRQRANAALSIKISKDKIGRARRITREMQLFWKKYSKVEKVHRKKAEKHALEQIRLDEEMREAKRQQRKLNFLISQTELFAHFISKKLNKAQDGLESDKRIESILNTLEKDYVDKDVGVSVSSEMHSESDEDDHDGSYYCDKALKNVKRALDLQNKQTNAFDNVSEVEDNFSDQYRLVNPSISASGEITQPSLFRGQLKSYQLKGMNWLINLYEQGINGILADEMGLGKTVQTIAFFGHLAEKINIWGPFLVVAPASTLNNWHQEFTKFFPDFKVLPYWGNTSDRKVLRKFWNLKASNHSDRHTAPFHVLITSYQLVISDVRYFQRIKWQYMVLDEAQAVKSSSSVRWKVLLDFNCRNRLLLTGTPIQNTMAELWALLHFIMPSLFDSHNEFNEWFSKDIENHIENKSNIDETQLSRLHMILKPFMLRRIKRDVENELSEKIEVRVHCSLTPRQRALYNAVKQKIRIEDLVKSNGVTYIATGTGGNTTLMNIVMQFRKVCNHPDLFERRKVTSPLHFDSLPSFHLPKLIYNEGILSRVSPGRRKLLYCDLNIHHPDNIHKNNERLSFLRLINISPSEYWSLITRGAQNQWSLKCEILRRKAIVYLKQIFHFDKNCIETSNSSSVDLHLISWNPHDLTDFGVFSPLKQILFTQNDSYIYTHSNLVMKNREHLEPVTIPKMLQALYFPSVTANAKGIYCNDSNACNELSRNVFGDMLMPLLYGPTIKTDQTKEEQQIIGLWTSLCKQANTGSGLTSFTPSAGWSNISIPNKEYLVTDSGKMYALDVLLKRLKNNGHRVLIYSQMTRMIDILEEYMWYRGHTYIRLDGSSRISERRDMVADFQSRSDIFAFLLSTRAGGLGINLTAADTVIFYDSDWNPTVDQQAMDRAHRLGQTKQVTVYRLVCQGTVDERILQRAEEKNAIQRMVIAGGSFKPDTLKPREVVSLLLDDEQLMQRLKMKREESKGEVLPYKGKKRGRKTNAEREAKRLKEMQEQGITDSSEHVTIVHSGSSSPASTSMFESKFVTGTSTPQDIDSESGSYFDSTPASPASGISACSDQRSLEDDLIVIDDNELPNPFSNTRTLGVRGRGCIRGRGRPRIRPLMPEATKRRYNRSTSASTSRGNARGKRASRVRRMFTGRAAAMAGARAGAVAASAATYATYGYGLEPTADSILQQKDKTVSNLTSTS